MKLRALVLGDASVPHAVRWCRKLSELDVEVALFSLESPIDVLNCRLYRGEPIAPIHRLRYLLSLKSLRKTVDDFQPHILNPHYIPNYGLMAVRLDSGLPIYLSVWGSDLLIVPKNNPIKFRVTSWILSRVDRIHVDAFTLAESLINDFGIPPSKIDVFPFGVEKVFLSSGQRELPRSGYIRVVSHRRLDPDMDPMTILKAAEILRDEPIEFVLLSDGSLAPELKKYVERKKLKVKFTSRLPIHELVSTLRSGHIWVSASVTDSTPVSLLEAMSLGLFPVVTNLASVREWIIHGINGMLFWPGDHIELAQTLRYIVKHPEKIGEAAELNRKIVRERADLERNMRRMVDIWRKMAGLE